MTVHAHPRPAATAAAPASARARSAYQQQSREALEEQWILGHLPLVRHIVNKIAGQARRGEEMEDLISAGTLGLVKAARGFDASRDAEFKTYAYIRVRGAVLDELRRKSFAPPSAHQQIRQVEHAYDQHVTQTGRPPTDEELSRASGLPAGQLYRVLEEARRQRFLSIHGLGNGEDGEAREMALPDRQPTPDAQAERAETLARLAGAIRELPSRDRTVLLLYYERDLTMKEAAQVLGVTESRISQLHASAVFKLSMKLRRPA